MNLKQIKALNAQLIEWADAYYKGSPIVTDAVFDAAEAQLRSLIDNNSDLSPYATYLTTVGSIKENGGRVEHIRPMLSIENYFTEDSFIKATKNYGTVLLIEPKRDGNSSELRFENGKLIQALTRGSGTAGEDMTAQVISLKSVPQQIKFLSPLNFRGELVMRNSELARINKILLTKGEKPYANTRNLVAGTLKQKNLKIVAERDIIFIPWDLYSPDDQVEAELPDSAWERMQLAHSLGFMEYEGERILVDPTIATFSSHKDFILEETHRILKNNEVSDIAADGVVIKADSHKLRTNLGVGSKYTKFQHCFKPQNLAAETILRSVEWGIGRQGRITPRPTFDPVTLGGAVITHANGNNETWMDNLKLMIGSRITVLRSGDVIPQITGVISNEGAIPIQRPTICPACGDDIVFDIDDDIVFRYCDNSECSGRAAELFAYIGHRDTLEIDNLGESMAVELIETAKVTNIAELFEFGNRMSADIAKYSEKNVAIATKQNGFRSGKNVVKMVKSLEEAKTRNWERWIAAMNIRMVGHSLGEDIAKLLNLGSNDMASLPKKLLTIPNIGMAKLGPAKTASLVKWAQNPHNIDLCKRLASAGVQPTALTTKKVATSGKGATLVGVNFVMTGELSLGTRKVIAAQLEALGAEELSAVSSTCNLLIVGENPGGKLAKAKAKNIKIVGEDWVKEHLGL